jgi:3',5'-cyclic AMP phosphodiesterase CpdA
VLNRDFVLDQMDLVCAELERGTPEERRSTSLPFDHRQPVYTAAASQLRDAQRREMLSSSGQPGYEDATSERRNDPVAPLDDHAFVSRDPLVCLLQTALEEFFETQRSDLISEAPPFDDDRRGPDDDVVVTDVALANCPPTRSPDGDRRVFGAFSETDPKWLASWMAEGIRLFNGKHAFQDAPATPFTIADKCRVICIGDWGSGLPRAQKVASEIRKVLDDGKQKGLQQHVIHLGDVYYSGWRREYENRFLASWPVRLDESREITSWSLNGNHDMYSGGHAYFDFLLADPRFAHQEGSSYFSISNANWDILGLDTAYEDAALYGPQRDWVRRILGQSKKKSMLLSHHQLFSAYEGGSALLGEALRDILGGPKAIDVWFWGHEHRCVFYRPHQNVRNARLIGHGGVPVYMLHRNEAPYPEPAYYEYREYLSKSLGLEHFALFGFAVLEFDGPVLRVRYIDENGRQHAEETIQ